MRMLISGPPPKPISAPSAVIIVTTGAQTPTPASAASPAPAMWPTYIRSTTLYNILTNCASIAGIASCKTSFPTGAVPSGLSVWDMVLSPFCSLYYSEIRRRRKEKNALTRGQGIRGLLGNTVIIYECCRNGIRIDAVFQCITAIWFDKRIDLYRVRCSIRVEHTHNKRYLYIDC